MGQFLYTTDLRQYKKKSSKTEETIMEFNNNRFEKLSNLLENWLYENDFTIGYLNLYNFEARKSELTIKQYNWLSKFKNIWIQYLPQGDK